jgi:D-aminoacyl-tRNA deacylase
MIAVVQRVCRAQVVVADQVVGRIGAGLLVLAAVEAADTPAAGNWLAAKILALRLFRNADKHFDLDIQQLAQAAASASPGTAAMAPDPVGVLLISNFTVAAETASGRRPSLSNAAPPARGRELFDHLLATLRRLAPSHVAVETGQFGAAMQVELVNDGPATFLLQSPKTNP